jgi:signal transduction histidine kinase/ActR/RegA family two-component response regulator
MQESNENRILILTPFGKDAAHLHKVLSSEGFLCFICANSKELTHESSKSVGVVLLTEEVLVSPDSQIFVDLLRRQPPWSAIPVLAFYSEEQAKHAAQKKAQHPLNTLTDVTFLQKPVSSATLFSAIKTALRDRVRQYKIRDLLQELQIEAESKAKYAEQEKAARIYSEKTRAEALEASKLKSQFLANMSHEIRTPLGAIMGFLDLIRDPALTPEERDQFITIVTRNSVQLMRIIDDILDLSKVESGKMELELLEFSLADLIFDVAALMDLKAREKGISFDVQLSPSLPKKIGSDPGRIRQVLTNAVGNAIKFTETGRVQMQCTFVNSILKFIITDSGRGISSAQTEKLFQPFVQADSSTTRKYGGTGLGLILSKRICEQMGGDYVLEKSELDVGSTFTASFLVQVPSAPKNLDVLSDVLEDIISENRHALQNSPSLAMTRILLVEDTPDNQILLMTVLKGLGAEIALANNGREGVQMALNNTYDIVLMDIQMPYMDGHEATKKLRAEGFTKPIIALTAHAMKEERDRTMASGFSDYLTKPIHRESLDKTIQKFRNGIQFL